VKTKQNPVFALADTLTVRGFRKNPFPIDETDDLFFSTATLAKQIEVLRNLVNFGDLLLVVSGAEGAGKTTFLNQFVRAADRRWNCCRIDARAAMILDSMVDELLRGFGLNAQGNDARSNEALLRAHLTDLHSNGDIAVVTVDDAHLLTPICSEFLLGLAQPHEDIELRLLLSAEPGRLGFPTNDAKRVHVVVLQAFNEQQCGDYIHARLRYGGLGGNSPFSATMVEEIHQDSGGLPGTIHSLALHALLANTDTAQVQRRPSKISPPMIYLAAALVIAVGGAVFLRPDPGFEPVAGIDAGATGMVRGPPGGETAGPDASQTAAPGNERQAVKAVAAEPEPLTGSVTAKAPAVESKQAPASVVRARASGDTKVFALDESGAFTRPANIVVSPGPVKGVTFAVSMAQMVRLAGNVTPGAGASARSRAAHDLDWLRKQEASNYVIQLVGTRDRAAAGKFVDDHKLGSKGAWFLTSHENKPWYVVVYGMYPDDASARVAIKTLPEALRAGSPWPRSLANVVESAR
jgi:DamX protein